MLYDLRYKWEAIGLELGLARGELKNLKGDDDEKLRDVVEKWLKRRQLNPTWSTLAAALRQKTVDADNVADEIEEVFVKCMPVSKDRFLYFPYS